MSQVVPSIMCPLDGGIFNASSCVSVPTSCELNVHVFRTDFVHLIIVYNIVLLQIILYVFKYTMKMSMTLSLGFIYDP